MQLDKEFLKKSIVSLREQKNDLTEERDGINEKIVEVKGALKWVEQTLKLMK